MSNKFEWLFRLHDALKLEEPSKTFNMCTWDTCVIGYAIQNKIIPEEFIDEDNIHGINFSTMNQFFRDIQEVSFNGFGTFLCSGYLEACHVPVTSVIERLNKLLSEINKRSD